MNYLFLLLFFVVAASPSNTLTKRPREEEQETMSADTQTQDEPNDTPICKRVRIHRVGLEVSAHCNRLSFWVRVWLVLMFFGNCINAF